MKKVFSIIMLAMTGLLSAALFVACGDVESEFSTAPCALYFDNQTQHKDATLAQAMTPLSGIFVTITTTSKSGAQYFVFTGCLRCQGQATAAGRTTHPWSERRDHCGIWLLHLADVLRLRPRVPQLLRLQRAATAQLSAQGEQCRYCVLLQLPQNL